MVCHLLFGRKCKFWLWSAAPRACFPSKLTKEIISRRRAQVKTQVVGAAIQTVGRWLGKEAWRATASDGAHGITHLTRCSDDLIDWAWRGCAVVFARNWQRPTERWLLSWHGAVVKVVQYRIMVDATGPPVRAWIAPVVGFWPGPCVGPLRRVPAVHARINHGGNSFFSFRMMFDDLQVHRLTPFSLATATVVIALRPAHPVDAISRPRF